MSTTTRRKENEECHAQNRADDVLARVETPSKVFFNIKENEDEKK